jgi:hypothetical protein
VASTELTGLCKLCGLEKVLLKKSHIIPEFMYQFLFDGNHKFRLTPSSELLKENPKSKDKAPKITFYQKDGHTWNYVENIDYKKFKLFLLSILWRASVTKLPVFSEIQLGPHQEKIRKMIFEDDPGEEDDYPVQMWTTVSDKNFPKDCMLQPRTLKLDGHRICLFPISGLFILFFISNHSKKSDVYAHTIKKVNTINIIDIPAGQGWAFISKYLKL